jgi:hypothetical protein
VPGESECALEQVIRARQEGSELTSSRTALPPTAELIPVRQRVK